MEMNIFENKFKVIEIDKDFKSHFKERRDCFSRVKAYIDEIGRQTTICVVSGLRRTGKTVLLEQAIESLSEEQKSKSLFIIGVRGKTKIRDLIEYIKNQIGKGYNYFFIDNITEYDGFYELAPYLSDNFVNVYGTKIVVTSSNSLGVALLEEGKMHNKMEVISTAYTTFAEYSKITGISTVDEFIEKGSALSTELFDTYEKTRLFIEVSIVGNIINSLMDYEKMDNCPEALTKKYSIKTIHRQIEQIINKYVQEIIGSVMKNYSIVKHNELSKVIESILESDRDLKRIYQLDDDEKSEIADEDIAKINDYLVKIGVFKKVPVTNSYEKENLDNKTLSIILHPGMISSMIMYVLTELTHNQEWVKDLEYQERVLVLRKAWEMIREEMVENIMLSGV